MFDTHVNLHAEAFESDLDDVLTRAREAGITRMLAICERFDSYQRIQALTEEHDDIWGSVGTHPHYSKAFPSVSVADLVDRALGKKIVAIGETGLDLHYGYSPLDDQTKSFRKHIEASRETGLPLIVHTREADDLTGDILEEESAKGAFPILLHCYTGGQRLAERGLALGAYVSVSGILSFKNATDVRDVIKSVPIERVILETDCPYLAPVPYRGRRNEPAYLKYVGEAFAALHNMSLDEVIKATESNALKLFWKVS